MFIVCVVPQPSPFCDTGHYSKRELLIRLIARQLFLSGPMVHLFSCGLLLHGPNRHLGLRSVIFWAKIDLKMVSGRVKFG